MKLEAGTKVVLVGDGFESSKGRVRTITQPYTETRCSVEEAAYWVETDPESKHFETWGTVVLPEDYKWRTGDTVKLTGEDWFEEMRGEECELTSDENIHGIAEINDEDYGHWDVENGLSDYYNGDFLAELVKIANPDDLLAEDGPERNPFHKDLSEEGAETLAEMLDEDEPKSAHKVGDIVRLTGSAWSTETDAKFADVTEILNDGAEVRFLLNGEDFLWTGFISGSRYAGEFWGVQWIDSAETLPASEQDEYDRLKFPYRANTLEDLDKRIREKLSEDLLSTDPEKFLADSLRDATQAMLKEEESKGTFSFAVREVLGEVGVMLEAKNTAYGNSALDPVRIFSDASPIEQLKVRIDDKLSRLQRGSRTEDVPEDTVMDLIGYLVLFQVAKNKENE